MTIDRIEITLNEADLLANGRSYMAGRWECPNDCDPRTGERRHYSQSFGNDVNGFWIKCSCGVEEIGLTGAELHELRNVHRPP